MRQQAYLPGRPLAWQTSYLVTFGYTFLANETKIRANNANCGIHATAN